MAQSILEISNKSVVYVLSKEFYNNKIIDVSWTVKNSDG